MTIPATTLRATLFLLCLLVMPGPGWAAAPSQADYPSAEEAVSALIDAVRSSDPARLRIVLGPGSEKLIDSGDRYADAESRQWFVTAYQEQHGLAETGPDRMVLTVGKDPWPMPIPVVKAKGRWHFDSAAGAQELVNRRIGRNEISAIRTALAYVDAQAAYRAGTDTATSGKGEYAQRLISQQGKRDGLYWPAEADAADASPLAQVIADAREHGYPVDVAPTKPTPYQGYLYRILKAQGPNAQGGAFGYIVDGRMTKGFALVAWPAIHGSSGVMTFVVNQNGVVYQKDLGERTASVASAMTRFDPDITWARIDITGQ
jgi:hypothetical protein